MKENSQHKNIEAIDCQSRDFFKGGTFHWKKSNDNVWVEIESKIDSTILSHSLKINLRTVGLSIAAGLALLIGVTAFLRLYTITIEVPAGKHQLAMLPDGSTVELNAESTLKYHPYWWKIDRQLSLDGEGYFEVEKGKKFSVKSSKGTTQVLGTTFNIFSRKQVYEVICLTGKVRVISKIAKDTAIITSNCKAEIKQNGIIEVKNNIEVLPEISWKQNLFIFTATPLREVFYEIERQFDVTIHANIDSYSLYSGNFSKSSSVEEVLSYVCPAMGLSYKQKTANEYVISQNAE